MRILSSIVMSICISTGAYATTLSTLPFAVRSVLPKAVSQSPKNFSEGLARLEVAIQTCGEGVVVGVKGSDDETPAINRCGYQIKLDELYFSPRSKMTGLLPNKSWAYMDGVTWVTPNVNKDDLPDTYDLRDLMRNGQPTIKTQKCGDCWAWSTHHGLEIARAIHDQQVLDLSIQTVLSCSRKGSCAGGYMSAVDFLAHGLPEEREFPYAASDRYCMFSDTEISTGWEGKVEGTPYIGDSMRYSLAKRNVDGTYLEGTHVSEMIAALHEWQSPLVVTVAAYDISGPGVYDSCSAINSDGDHMVTIVGWDKTNGNRNAHVWNSWGQSHGQNGVSRIKWECGNGQLNRGLGVAAKIVQYKMACTPPNAAQTYMHEIQAGGTVEIGAAQSSDVTCSWQPTTGLTNPNSCVTQSKATRTTEYHLTAKNRCGTSSSMALVYVWPADNAVDTHEVLTPFGVTKYDPSLLKTAARE